MAQTLATCHYNNKGKSLTYRSKMSNGVFVEINRENAALIAKSALHGAFLDEIRVAGVQLTLRFGNGQLIEGAKVTVDIVFTCDASVLPGIQGGDFHLQRAKFLFDIYGLYGTAVDNVELDDRGFLELSMNSRKVELRPDPQNPYSDDYTWEIHPERAVPIHGTHVSSLGCLAEREVRFYVGDKGSAGFWIKQD